MNEYVYSQTTAATTIHCTTSVQQIGQTDKSTNRKALHYCNIWTT